MRALGAAMIAAATTLGCLAADPIDLGNDFSDAPIVETPSPGDDEGEPSTLPDPSNPQPGVGLDAELSNKGQSPYCRARFEACGGDPTGYWEVEDTCNPETISPKTRRIWGRARMDLSAGSCAGAVERLSAVWSGNLDFADNEVIDQRFEQQRVDIAISRACLEDTLGLAVDAPLLPEACDTFEDANTTCTSSGGICRCAATTTAAGDLAGTYEILGDRMFVENGYFYDFCATGGRLLWREPGSTRHLVLRPRRDPGPATLPGQIDIPR